MPTSSPSPSMTMLTMLPLLSLLFHFPLSFLFFFGYWLGCESKKTKIIAAVRVLCAFAESVSIEQNNTDILRIPTIYISIRKICWMPSKCLDSVFDFEPRSTKKSVFVSQFANTIYRVVREKNKKRPTISISFKLNWISFDVKETHVGQWICARRERRGRKFHTKVKKKMCVRFRLNIFVDRMWIVEGESIHPWSTRSSN